MFNCVRRAADHACRSGWQRCAFASRRFRSEWPVRASPVRLGNGRGRMSSSSPPLWDVLGEEAGPASGLAPPVRERSLATWSWSRLSRVRLLPGLLPRPGPFQHSGLGFSLRERRTLGRRRAGFSVRAVIPGARLRGPRHQPEEADAKGRDTPQSDGRDQAGI